MAITITDTTNNPLLMPSAQAIAAYKGVTVTDTAPLSATETVTITLAQSETNNPGNNFSYYPMVTNFGTISDPNGGGTFNPNTETFTESGLIGGDPTFATSLLQRLQYTAPNLPNGQSFATQAQITVTDGSGTTSDSKPVIVGVLSPPSIAETVANEPIASGDKIPPFATLTITDASFSYYYYTLVAGNPYSTETNFSSYSYSTKETAVITITDGGKATDADGLLTGAGLSKTGVGTYSVGSDYPYNIEYDLRGLSFQTTAVAAGQTSNPSFELDVTDSNSNLTSKDTTTSLLIIGPPLQPVAPSIAGAQAGQTVVSGNLINPFASVTISDANLKPTDSVTITVMDASGKATDANGSFAPATSLTETAVGSGVYTLAASDTASLTTEIDNLTFIPAAIPSGQPSVTTNFKIGVTDTGVNMTGTDTRTTVIETQPPPPPPPPNPPNTNNVPPPGTNNFLVHDETSGQVYSSPGETYTGPVTGLTNDIIVATSDNINVNAEVANTFIKTGSGEDAIDVSAANGNNVMDGGTGSNFLTGGSGTDTFFVDDRSAPADIWSTVSGFHAGDAATIWGVTPQDFSLTWVDGQGAAGNTGLTLHATASGQPTASLTLAGYTSADMSDGRLSVSFGTVGGSAYMYVHGNS